MDWPYKSKKMLIQSHVKLTIFMNTLRGGGGGGEGVAEKGIVSTSLFVIPNNP